MYLAYVDDSGDSKHGITLTAVLVEDRAWNAALEAWLDGRRSINAEFGVSKTTELHAVDLYKGRGLRATSSGRTLTPKQRAAMGRIMLSHLAKPEGVQVVTLAMSEPSKPMGYARLISWLDRWADDNDTTVMVLYDGRQGYPASPSDTERQALDKWETALRDASPLRDVHRNLPITTRRIVEDVVMQDSRYNQLIQAADLVAYGAFHKHVQEHQEIWGTGIVPVPDAIKAYMQLRERWVPDTDHGIVWLG